MTIAPPPRVYLPPAQRRVLAELRADGAPNRTIATRLGMGKGTVESHLSGIRRALDLHSSTAVVAHVLQGRVQILDRPDKPTDVAPVHLAPAPRAFLLAAGCCHRLTIDLPDGDGLTRVPAKVTCRGAA